MPNLRPVAFIALVLPAAAMAHVPGEIQEDHSALVLSGLLLLSAVLYAGGFLRLWPHVHARAQLWWRAVAYVAGWMTLVVALLSPLDRAASGSFAWHMIQHETLMLIAAPLLVIGRALPTFLWALPHGARVSAGHATKASWFRGAWNRLTSPLSAWLLHAAALWLWHAPALFNAAVTNATVHDWQHATFLVTALIFWHALLNKSARARRGLALLYLFTTTIHTGVLGALLTFAGRPFYATLDGGLREASSLSALEDQQLGGLIMWVPGSIVYVAAALILAARWLSALDGHGAPRSTDRPSSTPPLASPRI
ncbi:MAG TPA: cytochrome c oxidase assembly protein [Steroidobacteraceae bacterium]|nr:cytochrome c oxidase assembly protein [Steroidobacteraceae bacterium]